MSLSLSFSLPKCGKGKPALVRRHTIEDRSELISCIENGNYARAARIAAGMKYFYFKLPWNILKVGTFNRHAMHSVTSYSPPTPHPNIIPTTSSYPQMFIYGPPLWEIRSYMKLHSLWIVMPSWLFNSVTAWKFASSTTFLLWLVLLAHSAMCRAAECVTGPEPWSCLQQSLVSSNTCTGMLII